MKSLIGRLFHVSYTVEGTWRLLKRHGWSWQQPDPPSRRTRRRGRGAVEEGRLAAGKSTAAACNGWIVFVDEAGQSMTPPRARTWGRIGQTPVVRVRGRGSGRVSMAGMTCYRHLAHCVPAAHLRTGPEPAGGIWALVKRDTGNLAAADLGQITRVVKRRLKQIQYRLDLVDDCLTGTGLIMDG